MLRPIIEITKEMRDVFSQYELTRKELHRTEELIDKIENQKITISLIGQFKRGKSMLVNSILGERILLI
jgi:predicted GTPase